VTVLDVVVFAAGGRVPATLRAAGDEAKKSRHREAEGREDRRLRETTRGGFWSLGLRRCDFRQGARDGGVVLFSLGLQLASVRQAAGSTRQSELAKGRKPAASVALLACSLTLEIAPADRSKACSIGPAAASPAACEYFLAKSRKSVVAHG